ncbi:protocadherin alpha-6-like [Physella acuta]|uniref:protocadherin alpha-6-like n=1 Tax=Physella acuta TaxID=109671 RepID=UPI0027DD38AE|nr:protocadherin alpha-6-like [Physella acuta]
MDIGTFSLWIRICFMIVLIHTSECQNRPKCPKSYYSATVTEPGKIGNTVLRLSCSDVDNNVITYSWDINGGGNFDSQFALSSVTGVLTLNKLADAEYKLSGTSNYASPYTMRVLVKDKDGTTVVTVFVVIKSINDNTPFIVLPSSKLTVSESTKLGTVLTSCTLDDLDLPGSGHDIPYVKIIGEYV